MRGRAGRPDFLFFKECLILVPKMKLEKKKYIDLVLEKIDLGTLSLTLVVSALVHSSISNITQRALGV